MTQLLPRLSVALFGALLTWPTWAVDVVFQPLATKIEAAAEKVTAQPITWIINTGGQDHRWLADGCFSAQGVDANAQADMTARLAEPMQGLKVLKERLDGTVPTLPSRLITGPDNRRELGQTVFELKYRGGGHTPGDMLVWLPQKNVLISGDVVYVDRAQGLLEPSNSKAWLATFAVIDALQPKIRLPGHGSVTDMATARAETRDLLLALRARII